MKICEKCKQEKAESDFFAMFRKKECKLCKDCRDKVYARGRKYRKANPKKRRAWKAAWDKLNPLKRLAMHKAWRKEHPEQWKRTQRKSAKKWKDAHPEWVRETSRKHAAKHRPEAVERVRQWRKDNPDDAQRLRQEYRASKRNAGGSYTSEEWRRLVAESGSECIGTGPHGGKLTPDHVIPLSRGGSNGIENIQVLCFKCNMRKHTAHTDYRKSQSDAEMALPGLTTQ